MSIHSEADGVAFAIQSQQSPAETHRGCEDSIYSFHPVALNMRLLDTSTLQFKWFDDPHEKVLEI
ncbi:hypothetical protein BD309DRAFT_27578 [Dichomitus squalens]|nr:hypothetical protein BD309DRAFT_27578 [Dichomitus squalens]